MKKRDLWIIGCALALAAALFLCAKLLRAPVRAAWPATLAGVSVEMDDRVRAAGGAKLWRSLDSGRGDAPSTLAEAGIAEAESYAVVRLGDYFFVLPLTEAMEGATVTVRRADPEAVNVLALGRNRFNMLKADCPDGLCLTEGEVTLDNRETRPLQSMLICLPHALLAQMVGPDELLELLAYAEAMGETT